MRKNSGQLVAIVGPSGVGKDSIIEGLKQACPDIKLVKRVITRDAEAGGEDFLSVSEDAFAQLKSDGAFALDWPAHGLHYGIPISIDADLQDGKLVLFNGSRAALPIAQKRYPNMKVIVITAKAESLAARLKNRGRESEADIAQRLARATSYEPPEGPNVFVISNDGALGDAVNAIKNLLMPQVESVQ